MFKATWEKTYKIKSRKTSKKHAVDNVVKWLSWYVHSATNTVDMHKHKDTDEIYTQKKLHEYMKKNE